MFVTPNGNVYSKSYDERGRVTVNTDSRLPLAQNYNSWLEYVRAINTWEFNVENDYQACFSPVPVSCSYHIPRPPAFNAVKMRQTNPLALRSINPVTSPLMAQNQLQLQRILIDEEDFDENGNFEKMTPKKEQVPIENHLRVNPRGIDQFVSLEPIPECFDTYEEYRDALIKWMGANNTSVEHPSDLQSMMIEKVPVVEYQSFHPDSLTTTSPPIIIGEIPFIDEPEFADTPNEELGNSDNLTTKFKVPDILALYGKCPKLQKEDSVAANVLLLQKLAHPSFANFHPDLMACNQLYSYKVTYTSQQIVDEFTHFGGPIVENDQKSNPIYGPIIRFNTLVRKYRDVIVNGIPSNSKNNLILKPFMHFSRNLTEMEMLLSLFNPGVTQSLSYYCGSFLYLHRFFIEKPEQAGMIISHAKLMSYLARLISRISFEIPSEMYFEDSYKFDSSTDPFHVCLRTSVDSWRYSHFLALHFGSAEKSYPKVAASFNQCSSSHLSALAGFLQNSMTQCVNVFQSDIRNFDLFGNLITTHVSCLEQFLLSFTGSVFMYFTKIEPTKLRAFINHVTYDSKSALLFRRLLLQITKVQMQPILNAASSDLRTFMAFLLITKGPVPNSFLPGWCTNFLSSLVRSCKDQYCDAFLVQAVSTFYLKCLKEDNDNMFHDYLVSFIQFFITALYQANPLEKVFVQEYATLTTTGIQKQLLNHSSSEYLPAIVNYLKTAKSNAIQINAWQSFAKIIQAKPDLIVDISESEQMSVNIANAIIVMPDESLYTLFTLITDAFTNEGVDSSKHKKKKKRSSICLSQLFGFAKIFNDNNLSMKDLLSRSKKFIDLYSDHEFKKLRRKLMRFLKESPGIFNDT